MKIADNASIDDNTNGDGESAPRTGLTPDALPEVQEPVWAENLQSGVSTRNALSGSTLKTIKRKPKDGSHWYALRVTYGREKKVYDYLFGKHVEAYYPTIKTVKEVDGKRKTVEESRLPNILFARGTEEEIKSFVYDNVNLPHLRFYYRHFHEGARLIKEPLIVPDYQIEGLKIICASEAEDVVIVPQAIQKFQTGQTVLADTTADTSIKNGLFHEGTDWNYYVNGEIAIDTTTLVKYNGNWWYVRNGKIDFDSHTLCKYNGNWFYVRGGYVRFSGATLCKYNGSWFYVKGGYVRFNEETLCLYNGVWYYVNSGVVNFAANKKVNYNGGTYNVQNGIVVFN